VYDFVKQLNFSMGVDVSEGILEHLKSSVPLASGIRMATPNEDRHGTDVWIDRTGLPSISVDFKHRSFCPIDRFGRDDACIEVCSVCRNGKREKPGWTIDSRKRTDIVVYTWPAGASRRFWILWFPFLCRTAMQRRSEWEYRYGVKETRNNGYVTLNVYVPRRVIARAMRELVSGTV
jgi:hypothetical protein